MSCGVITLLMTGSLQEEKEHTQENKPSEARSRGGKDALKSQDYEELPETTEAGKRYGP